MMVVLLVVLILGAATLYSSVGHGGASGYLAVMALVGVAATTMKPVALVLNIIVATIATIRFYRAGSFSWRTLWPFLIGSVPLAYVGGVVHLPGRVYKPLVGVILLFTAGRLAWSVWRGNASLPQQIRAIPTIPAILWGGVIGLLSGLTGTGGGIFLSPLLLFAGWAEMRESAGVASTFILANSIAGLAGASGSLQNLPSYTPLLALAAVAGGFIGTQLGTRRLPSPILRYLLSAVLVIASFKLMLT